MRIKYRKGKNEQTLFANLGGNQLWLVWLGHTSCWVIKLKNDSSKFKCLLKLIKSCSITTRCIFNQLLGKMRFYNCLKVAVHKTWSLVDTSTLHKRADWKYRWLANIREEPHVVIKILLTRIWQLVLFRSWLMLKTCRAESICIAFFSVSMCHITLPLF